MKIFSSIKSRDLAEKIIYELNTKYAHNIHLGKLNINKFSDGEILPKIDDDIKNSDVFFINTLDTADSILETILVVDAAKRLGCKKFILVAPYLSYSRQDKVDHVGSSLGAQSLARTLENSGINILITIDLHSSKVKEFYQIPVIEIDGKEIFKEFFVDSIENNTCLISPDQGGVSKMKSFLKDFPYIHTAVMSKKRVRPNEVKSLSLKGQVRGKDVIILDDIADTLGTIVKASQLLLNKGANSVKAVATHGVLSGSAFINLEKSSLTELVVSDTLNNINNPKLKVISSYKAISKHIHLLVNK
jgi:ribose-phosphate pyrophosphokinase